MCQAFSDFVLNPSELLWLQRHKEKLSSIERPLIVEQLRAHNTSQRRRASELSQHTKYFSTLLAVMHLKSSGLGYIHNLVATGGLPERMCGRLGEGLGLEDLKAIAYLAKLNHCLKLAGSSKEGPIFNVHSIGINLSRDWGGLEMKI